MIRDARWRLGNLIGVLVLLWTLLFPFLAHAGFIPITISAANIGAGFLFIAPFGLTEFLMVLFAFFRTTRPVSFGLAIPLLVLYIGQIWLSLALGPLGAFLFDLPGSVAFLVVGIVYFLNKDNYSHKQLNPLEEFSKQEW